MQILEGIPEDLRKEAAEIFWDAFRDKLFHALGPSAKAHAYFRTSFQSEQALTAVENGKLLGIAGYDIGNGSLVSDRFSDMFTVYGLSAFWRSALLIPFGREYQKDSLQLDGIAVAPDRRGQGVGTSLLEAVFEKARASGCKAVYLDVMDNNIRARALYEHMGFEAVKPVRMSFLSKYSSFRAATKMVKTL